MDLGFVDNVFYTTEEVAAILRMHVQTVRRMCRSGEIRAVSGHGGYRVLGANLREFGSDRCRINEKTEKRAVK